MNTDDIVFFDKVEEYLKDKNISFLEGIIMSLSTDDISCFLPKKSLLPSWWYLEIMSELDNIRETNSYLDLYESYVVILSKIVIVLNEKKLELIKDQFIYNLPIEIVLNLFKLVLVMFDIVDISKLQPQKQEIPKRKLTIVRKE